MRLPGHRCLAPLHLDRRPRRCSSELWPTVEAGVDFVLRWQRLDGSIRWSLDSAGLLEEYALLTAVVVDLPQPPLRHRHRASASASERPDWELAAGRLAHAVAHDPAAFAPKVEFAMDWYYPVLAGVLGRAASRERLGARLGEFVLPARGVRCRSDRRWVTASETAECAVALARVGWTDRASALLATHRRPAVRRRLVPDGPRAPRAIGVPARRAHDVLRGGGHSSPPTCSPGASTAAVFDRLA